jgi:PAS domain S-box-containing protein
MLTLDWHFLPVFDHLDRATAYLGTYDWILVATSVAIAILAAFVALSISGRIIAASSPRTRYAWASAGAISMGGGIWSMHFVGMLAFSLPCGITYDPLGTLFSIIPGMLASGIALGAISKPDKASLSRLSISAILMGLGIALMHYSGMAAMRPEALLRYDFGVAALSVVVAVVLAFVSLSIQFPFHRPQSSRIGALIIAASIMGCAVAGMHYTAMAASIFFPLPSAPTYSMALSPTLLALLITIFTVLIAVTTLVAAFAGRQSELASSLSAEISLRKRSEEDLRRSEAYLAEAQRLTHTGSWAWDARSEKMLYCSEEMLRMFGLDPNETPPTRESVQERTMQPHAGNWSPNPHAGRLFHCSDELPRVFGLDARQTTPSREALDQRIHPEDRDKVNEAARDALRRKTEYTADFRIAAPGGIVKHIQATGHPSFDASGEIAEYVGTAVDVTERKRAEAERERLRELEAELAHMNRVTTMGELAASLAHELNQPITAAIANANACLRWLSRATPDLQEACEATLSIVKDGTRAAEIISRMKSFYKKGAPPQRELIDVNEVAEEIVMLLRSEANRHSIALRTDFAPLPKVMVDRVQLQQVFMNLMLNGIEAMQQTRGELAVKSQPMSDDQLLISVTDTGVGLPAGGAQQMFSAFYTTKPNGTGMGLAISRSIIEAHGGRLWATGNPGPGATFHFTLPREMEKQAVSPAGA